MPKLLNSTALTGDFTANTDQFFIDQSTGRIGIGTTTPGAQIEIEESQEKKQTIKNIILFIIVIFFLSLYLYI